MLGELAPIAQVGPLVGAQDRRTIERRLAALGVRVVTFGRRRYVDPSEVSRAVRAAARPLGGGVPATPRGVNLAPGERLWWTRPIHSSGPAALRAPRPVAPEE